MEVFALVGKSGTGKSHRALIVAHENNVDAIIDDGLLIKDNKIIAGSSSKREKSKLQAVRRAIFTDPKHAKEVSDAIIRINPKRLLILGTSENMIGKILLALNLPESNKIDRIIRITDIASEKEIDKAREARIKEGKHIIPVPTIEIKPHFSGYLIDPLQIFSRKSRYNSPGKVAEKSIIRPTFSYYGKLIISDAAISAIVKQVACEDKSITKVNQVNVKGLKTINKELDIALEVTIRYGSDVVNIAKNAQKRVKNMVEIMTGIPVNEVNVIIKRISFE
ncbi:Asp23/Gls24 family envelope stress response protein [Selenomonadales bacterium OttesenSCG-928-I06]|nr:Asp23/Gls24 family envelope stress response protein [Selenomonadales bacterium OttesenSCG-928-I06]